MDKGKMLTTRYSLEIYEPNSVSDVCVHFSSSTPFQSIAKDDIINPGLWPNSKSPMKVLKVVSVEHMVWEIENSHITHKICVFTKEVDDTEKLRLNRMELSEKDRLVISNQLKILEKLYPEEAKDYALHRKAIEDGYMLHYSWLAEGLYDEMSEADCREVLDILEMYRAITFSYKKAKDKEGLDEDKIKFHGFDGNEETRQFGYAMYFIIDLGRYGELKGNAEYPDLNSHGDRTLSDYRKMLKIWKNYKDKHILTIAQIKELLGT
jgi:hypothetical protein